MPDLLNSKRIIQKDYPKKDIKVLTGLELPFPIRRKLFQNLNLDQFRRQQLIEVFRLIPHFVILIKTCSSHTARPYTTVDTLTTYNNLFRTI